MVHPARGTHQGELGCPARSPPDSAFFVDVIFYVYVPDNMFKPFSPTKDLNEFGAGVVLSGLVDESFKELFSFKNRTITVLYMEWE
jgi:hypothetical protein